MKNEKIVTINGQIYNSATGLPMPKPNTPKIIARPSGKLGVDSIIQRSQDIHSRTPKRSITRLVSPTKNSGRSMDIARSKKISHFTKHPATTNTTKPKKEIKSSDIKPVKHPLALKTEKKRLTKNTVGIKKNITKTPKEIKNEAITEALNKPTPKPKKKNIFKRHHKLFNIFSISIILLIIIGTVVYISIPNISVYVASVRAGIKATYPEYIPDGYSLSGPVTYNDSEVAINFHANTGDGSFIIKQSKSSWDSSAVKEKITKDSKGQFITTEEKGLTIYTYDGNAAWVNGGILYTIIGNAPLSGEQIRKIATSL
ncbi:MAG: hypothetical protein PWQ10_222 [Patescibacteria group bacterium]|nr:hypothetical protein [Patescibacteria group bacterium]